MKQLPLPLEVYDKAKADAQISRNVRSTVVRDDKARWRVLLTNDRGSAKKLRDENKKIQENQRLRKFLQGDGVRPNSGPTKVNPQDASFPCFLLMWRWLPAEKKIDRMVCVCTVIYQMITHVRVWVDHPFDPMIVPEVIPVACETSTRTFKGDEDHL